MKKKSIGHIENPTPVKSLGPWKVTTGPHVVDEKDVNLALIQRMGYDSQNDFKYWERTDEECQRIAHLIASAPDMLEMLEQAWACIEHIQQYAPKDMQSDISATLKDIERIGLKAKGGSNG